MFSGEDLAARVRRKSDDKEFYLGLAEIEAIERDTLNYQLLDDYSVWFVNNKVVAYRNDDPNAVTTRVLPITMLESVPFDFLLLLVYKDKFSSI